MENKQTAIELNEYAKKNAKKMIERIIKLLEYQENVNISYELKKKEAS